jgi:hypothetical protein
VPNNYSAGAIKEVIERLRPYDLTKGEMVMLFNLRPSSVAALNTVIEDMSDRFQDEQQEEIVAIISEVLGQFGPSSEAGREEEPDVDADVSMKD